MRNLVILIGVLSSLFCSCRKEIIDPHIISRESIQGKWFLAKQVKFTYDPDSEQLTDSSVSYNLYELHIGETDICIKKQAGLPFEFEYEMGFIEPDTFWIMPCPIYTHCELLQYPEKYTIVDFNSNEGMIMLGWHGYYGLIERKEFIRI